MAVVAVLTLAIAWVPTTLSAQEEYVQNEAERAEKLKDTKKEKKKRDFVAAPIPIVNPTLGEGLGAIAMYLYKMDEGSQSSYTGVGGLSTNTESWGAGVAQALYLNEDAWKLKAGALYFDLNLDFFGIGNGAGDQGESVPVNQKGWGAGVKALRRLKGNWYAGLSYVYVRLESTFDLSDTAPGFPVELPPEAELDSAVAGLGLLAEYDTRDNQFNSYKGGLFEFSWSFANEALGSDFDFESVKAAYDLYRGVGKDKVIAARFMGCAAPGDAPYYALCKFGQGVDLRGYIGGQYRDAAMFATQAELRWRFWKRFGMVAFAGFGQVAESVSDFSRDNLLPSAGLGIRFMLSEEHRLNLSVDWARGKDSDAWYFYVGESF